jgi:hypothetical protein
VDAQDGDERNEIILVQTSARLAVTVASVNEDVTRDASADEIQSGHQRLCSD